MTDTPKDQNQPETDASNASSSGRNFSLGRTGRRIAVGASIAAAFLGGMAVYSAVDVREVGADQASLVTSGGGQSGGVPGGDPRWHDDDGDDDRYEHGDDDHYEGDDRYERDDDDHYEGDDRYERDDDDYVIPPAPSGAGNGNQPAPMQSGQS